MRNKISITELQFPKKLTQPEEIGYVTLAVFLFGHCNLVIVICF